MKTVGILSFGWLLIPLLLAFDLQDGGVFSKLGGAAFVGALAGISYFITAGYLVWNVRKKSKKLFGSGKDAFQTSFALLGACMGIFWFGLFLSQNSTSSISYMILPFMILLFPIGASILSAIISGIVLVLGRVQQK